MNKRAIPKPNHPPARVPLSQRYFFRLGTLGFGGQVALCGIMGKELVSEKS